jgi:hypothetical protein
MQLWNEMRIAVLVFDQPFGDGVLVHGEKERQCHHAADQRHPCLPCASAKSCTNLLDFAINSLYPHHWSSQLNPSQRWLLNLQAWPARASVAPKGEALRSSGQDSLKRIGQTRPQASAMPLKPEWSPQGRNVPDERQTSLQTKRTLLTLQRNLPKQCFSRLSQ